MSIEILGSLGINTAQCIHRNLAVPLLVEKSVLNGEGTFSATGALNVITGKYTGRSPNDRFIVDEPTVHDDIDWGKVNLPFSPLKFDKLFEKITAYFNDREIYVFDGYVGADEEYRLNIRVVNELASHNLFATQIFRRPQPEELVNFEPSFTVISAPGLKADPAVDGTNSEAFVIISFERRLVIIGGTGYAGEMKKSVFSVLNYLLPKRGVLPMHCSANIGIYDDVALFFGLSGTGKTTLSADPDRMLIGDDEHGWADNGVFNFEGGCYAKCIHLSQEQEPQIWNALRFGSLLENVVIDSQNCVPDYNDESLTENTRACYPVEYIPNASRSGLGGIPRTIVFLTADAFGVLPPVAKLSKEQAMYHFMSGYTSKLAGTERGITEPQATFSTCFGAPFMPMHASIYAKLLGEKIEQSGARVFLVNTGWTGGGYGVGKRISIAYTRAIITSILNGELDRCEYRRDPIFQVLVPDFVAGVPQELLTPRNNWQDKNFYDRTANSLARRFCENFAQFATVAQEIAAVGPAEA
ncbi:MAG: phosphoenolpyruvate carboxykinase (ATP) [Bacillota bacterium]|nr:MAG: phosphoenolpyruvate carboxykinase (ATP) [Bacillota bacterium]